MRLNHNKIDTEHLLLGLLQESQCVAVRILQEELGVNLEKLQMEVKAMIKNARGFTNVEQPEFLLSFDDLMAMVKNPKGFTPAAHQVRQYVIQEAKKVESDDVWDEHILLGLIREGNGIAAKALANFGVTLERVRKLVDTRPVLKLSSGQLNLNNVDKEIRDLVCLLNESPFLETSSSCSGHPDIPTREWWDGGICVDPTRDIGQTFSFLEHLRARLDNSRGLELSQAAKDAFYVNRTLAFFKQVEGEALYTSAIPIMTTYFWTKIHRFTTFEELTMMWNIALNITQEFIPKSEILPPACLCVARRQVETPEAGAEAFVTLLQSVPHIQEIYTVNYYHQPPWPWGMANIYFLWNRSSIQWGFSFINQLKTRFEKEFASPNARGGFSFRTSFVIKPIVHRNNLQRTREDHLKIWKLIELAAREYIHGELY